MHSKLILGIDGGGTKTTCLLFDSYGNTIDSYIGKGSNLYVFKDKAIKKIINMIDYILNKNKVTYNDIDACGIGIAGISDLNQREVLLKELDRIKLTSKTLLLSDSEAAYKILCPSNNGILINIGTGIICFARNSSGETIRVAGKWHDKGDIGSGYWLGKELLSRLILNEGVINDDEDLNQIYTIIKERFKVKTLAKIYALLDKKDSIYSYIAQIGEDAIDLAENGNDIALSIVQEGTRYVSDYILAISDVLKNNNKEILLAINGSVINNNFYRKLLEDSLQFDFKKIHWVSSPISPAYGSGILAANYKNINISINDIVKGLKN